MILCCGEALIDMLPVGGGDGAARFEARCGGAVFNTARALGRLGVEAGFLGGLSRDDFGIMLDRALTAAGVDTGLAPRFDRPTTLAFVQFVSGSARYSFHDENSAMRALEPGLLPALPDRVGVVFLGGIGLAVEPCGAALETLAMREAGRRLVMLDPNVRPAMVRDVATYRGRLARLIGRADILKLSEEDLDWLHPGESAPEVRAAALLDAGPALVVVTLGARGAVALGKGGLAVRVSARVVPVVDTVGAGDAFDAGFLAGLDEQGVRDRAGLKRLGAAGIGEALDLAVRVAAASLRRPGAHAPARDEI